MRNKIRIISLAMTVILAVSGMSTTALAAQLDDNPSGSTTSIGDGDTMDNNWGTITSNAGTLNNNEGVVEHNSGRVNDNWGDVTNEDGGIVGTNHTGGEVTDGRVTENYGTTNCSIVTNNYQSGNVNSGTLENNYLGQTDGADVTGQNISNEGAVPGGIPLNDPKPNAPVEPKQKKDEHHDDSSSSGDPVQTSSPALVSTLTVNETGFTNALKAVLLSGDESAWVNYDMGSDTTITETMLRALDDGTGHCIRSVQMKFLIDGREWFFEIPKGASLIDAFNEFNLSGRSQQVFIIYKLIGGNLYYRNGNLVVTADLVVKINNNAENDGQKTVSLGSERISRHARARAAKGGATTILENVEE